MSTDIDFELKDSDGTAYILSITHQQLARALNDNKYYGYLLEQAKRLYAEDVHLEDSVQDTEYSLLSSFEEDLCNDIENVKNSYQKSYDLSSLSTSSSSIPSKPLQESNALVHRSKQVNETITSAKVENKDGIETDNFQWSKPMILLLIHLVNEKSEELSSSKYNGLRIWSNVAMDMQSYNYTVTESQCRKKFHCLKEQYKRVKDHNNGTGNDKKNFKYYKEMDEICSKEVWVSPKSTISSENSSDDVEVLKKKFSTSRDVRKRSRSTNEILDDILEEKRLAREQRAEQAKKKLSVGKSIEKLL